MNKFDLEERTAKFGENIISLCKMVKITTITQPIISQVVRSGTSVGANYCEANNACSRKDFKNKIFISKKELQETKYWLRIIKPFISEDQTLNNLNNECQELILIFQKITKTLSSDTNEN